MVKISWKLNLTHDDLPLNELSKLHMLKLVVRPVFEEDGTFYHKFI